MDNAQIADRPDAFASLLELVEANPYTTRAYRRAAEMIRGAAFPVAELVSSGRARELRGIGAGIEARLREALAREGEPRPRRGLLLNDAWELVGGVAGALHGQAAGDVRRWRDSCEVLAVVCAAPAPVPVLARFAALPQIVALVEQGDRRAVGVTVEGVAIELVVAEPERFGTALVRATGSAAYVAALEPLAEAPDEAAVYRALELPWCPPELREQPFRGEPPALVEREDIRGDLHCHTTWSDGRGSVEQMGRAARERGYDYLAVCDHTPAVGAVRGLTPDDVRRQAEEIAAANDLLAPFRVLRGSSATSSPTGGSIFPTTSSRSSSGYRQACTAGSACRGGSSPGASRRPCATRTCTASAIRRVATSTDGRWRPSTWNASSTLRSRKESR